MFVANSYICAASDTLDDVSLSARRVHQETGSVIGRVFECCGCWCVRKALWKMMCATMCWCRGCLVNCSFFHVGFLYVFFPSQTGPSPYINKVISFSIFFPPQTKLRFDILIASTFCDTPLQVHHCPEATESTLCPRRHLTRPGGFALSNVRN